MQNRTGKRGKGPFGSSTMFTLKRKIHLKYSKSNQPLKLGHILSFGVFNLWLITPQVLQRFILQLPANKESQVSTTPFYQDMNLKHLLLNTSESYTKNESHKVKFNLQMSFLLYKNRKVCHIF